VADKKERRCLPSGGPCGTQAAGASPTRDAFLDTYKTPGSLGDVLGGHGGDGGGVGNRGGALDPCRNSGRRCELIVQESFEGDALDSSIWNVEVRNDGINDEQQAYVDGGVTVADGLLTLRLFYDPGRQPETCNADRYEYFKPSEAKTKTVNAFSTDEEHVGVWGGSCTCPDGQVYQVGDNGDFCKTIACHGGEAGKCHREEGPWAHNKVVCEGAQEGEGSILSVCQKSQRRALSGFYSGRVNTFGKVNLRHGVIEARVRLAMANPYAWSALWLLGSNVATIGWPHCGESELAEMWASTTDHAREHLGEKGTVGYAGRPAATVHTYHTEPPPAKGGVGPYERVQRGDKNAYVALNSAEHPNFPGFNASGFNVYRYEKMPRKVAWFINDQATVEAYPNGEGHLRVRARSSDGKGWGEAYGFGSWEPFEKEMSLLFNLAFASPWNHRDAKKNIGRYRVAGHTLDTAAMDWLRVWKVSD